MIARRCDYKNEQAFLSALPLLSLDADVERKSRRNALTSGIAAAFPFASYELSDTIRRLLDEYESGGSELPFFHQAMLVIDEHCSVNGRHIFDQDNKGWKVVSNAIKSRLIPDDDQHTLSLALLSSKSEIDVCNITLLDRSDEEYDSPPR